MPANLENSAEATELEKMMLLKCCTQYISKFGKLSRDHKTGKVNFLFFSFFFLEKSISFQSQRKAMPKNVQVKVAQLCLTLCDPMDCSLPDSAIHGILEGRILEWVPISFSRGSS